MCDQVVMTFCKQMLHVLTRRRVGVQHRAAMARVTWRASTHTTGACLAVRTKTGCHLKVSTSVTHQSNTGLAYLPNLWPWCALMVGNQHVSPDRCCVWLVLCAVHLLSWLDCVWYFNGGCGEGSDGLQLHFSCDLLHGAMILLADCLPSVAWWWVGKIKPQRRSNSGHAAIVGTVKRCHSVIYLTAWDLLLH